MHHEHEFSKNWYTSVWISLVKNECALSESKLDFINISNVETQKRLECHCQGMLHVDLVRFYFLVYPLHIILWLPYHASCKGRFLRTTVRPE